MSDPYATPIEYPAKLRINRPVTREEHRSGWRYALEALAPLCAADGILVDSFIERNFGWDLEQARATAAIPYREPWVGFLHNPPNIPRWHEYYSAPQVMMELPEWRQSIGQCRGLITLANWMADWLRERTSVPVISLVHPTEIPALKFQWERYRENPRPKIVQVGWWLRRLHSIYQLSAPGLVRAILNPVGASRQAEFRRVMEREGVELGLAGVPRDGVEHLPYLDAGGFDRLLSENLVFLDLFDSVCNNTVIECVVRETPVLINRLPCVEEYLGQEYPLYFSNLAEAGRITADKGRLLAAHRHLHALPKEPYTPEYFRRTLAESRIYRSL
ncbi:MAG: hypothetical protein ABSH56_26920 [Bryobacteraceae bacterium]|jgi:hypothetical protein